MLFLLSHSSLSTAIRGGNNLQSTRTLFLVEVAIFAAFAFVLDLIPSFQMPQGGSISFAMIPIFIISFRWGIKGGLLSGFLWGMMQLAMEPKVYSFWQAVIEYGFAFTVLGFAGIVAGPVHQAIKAGNAKKSFLFIMLGILLGSALRLLAHFFAGVVFFAEYAPKGQPAWLYSLIYNSWYMIPSFIICTVLVYFLFYKQPKALLKKAV